MTVIAEILRRKGTQVISVAAEDRAEEVADTLARHRIGAALVRDGRTGAVIGIVSERDFIRAIAGSGGTAMLGMRAADLMTEVLHTVTPRTSVVEALAMMTDRRVRHLPVLAPDGGLAGLVSIGDLVKYRIGEVEHEAEELRNYVVSAG